MPRDFSLRGVPEKIVQDRWGDPPVVSKKSLPPQFWAAVHFITSRELYSYLGGWKDPQGSWPEQFTHLPANCGQMALRDKKSNRYSCLCLCAPPVAHPGKGGGLQLYDKIGLLQILDWLAPTFPFTYIFQLFIYSPCIWNGMRAMDCFSEAIIKLMITSLKCCSI